MPPTSISIVSPAFMPAHSVRCAGHDDVARVEGHHIAQELDQERHAEDQAVGVVVLPELAIEAGLTVALPGSSSVSITGPSGR